MIPCQTVTIRTHPNMFLNQTEIDTIKSKLSTEPWRMTAYNGMIADANTALGITYANMPTIVKDHAGCTAVDQEPYGWDRHHYYDSWDYGGACDYDEALAFTGYVKPLGLAYQLSSTSDRSKYANKLIDYIYKWCLDPSYNMHTEIINTNNNAPEEVINQVAITLSSMLYGADLIWNYWGSDECDAVRKSYRQPFKDWVTSLTSAFYNYNAGYDGVCRESFCQNKEVWRTAFIACGASLTENSTLKTWAFDRFRTLLSPTYKGGVIGSDGCMSNEIERCTSLGYSLYTINALQLIAEVARHQTPSVDLYGYKNSEGAGLETAYDKYATYAQNGSNTWYHTNSSECPCVSRTGTKYCHQHDNCDGVAQPCTGCSGIREIVMSEMSVYELAYRWNQKTAYRNVFTSGIYSRPILDRRVLGYVTLTHGL